MWHKVSLKKKGSKLNWASIINSSSDALWFLNTAGVRIWDFMSIFRKWFYLSMEEIFRFLVVPCAHCRGCASDTYVIISRLPVYLKTSQGGRVLCYVKKWKKIRSLVEKLDCVKTFEQEGSLCEESKCIRFKSRIKNRKVPQL